MKGISFSKMTANRSWSKYQGVFVCWRLSTTKIIQGIIPCWCCKNRSWSFSIGPNEPKSGSKLTFKLWRMNSEITRLILFPFILYTPEIDLNFLKSSFSQFSITLHWNVKFFSWFNIHAAFTHQMIWLSSMSVHCVESADGAVPHGNQ